jgi:suppressor for copper-sensitivity B
MSRNQVRANFLSISAGIIVSFLLLALITLTMQYLGHEVGFGLHFQQPIFIITLILILVFFACNLLGIFEINLPSKINDLVLRSDSNNQLISHFLCGVFATIMATPCTAPFVGTAIGFALSSNWSNVILIFIAMGCGMALPFLILSALPQLVYFLPRPGPWMVVIKKLFGYLLFVTVIWLLYVTAGQLGTLPSLILFLLCVLIKFSLEHHNFLLKSTRSRFTIISIIIALSYILPLSLSGQLSVQENTANKIWQDFDETKIAQLIADNKIILIDITAAWCPSCQYNKLMVFKQAPIIQYLQEHDIVTMRANITSPDAKALAFIKKYNRHGIPFNIILSKAVPQGILLPEIFNQDELLKALKKAELK